MKAPRYRSLLLLPSLLLSGAAYAAEEQFDCADAFDLIAMTVTIRCAAYRAPAAANARIDAAGARLLATGLASPTDFESLNIAFCPLMQGTGMVPDAHTLLLDDGLQGLSIDGLAEIVAHEFEHLRQFKVLGPRGFKCAYVQDMMACGGCQDRRHPLERAAYDRQDEARQRLSAHPDTGADEHGHRTP